jgi:hypothetical protein
MFKLNCYVKPFDKVLHIIVEVVDVELRTLNEFPEGETVFLHSLLEISSICIQLVDGVNVHFLIPRLTRVVSLVMKAVSASACAGLPGLRL